MLAKSGLSAPHIPPVRQVGLTGPGVQVGTLHTTGGTLEASAHILAVSDSANLNGVLLTPSGGSLTLSGANLIAPDADNHRMITCDAGTLTVAHFGLDVILNAGLTSTGSTTLDASGNYTLTGANLPDFGAGNGYFHYVPLPPGDFDVKVHLASTPPGNWTKAGIMARDSVNPNGTGNWAVMYSSDQTTFSGTGFAGDQIRDGTGQRSWLRLRKAGTTLSGFYSSDGVSYTQMGPDKTISGWSTTTPTYLGMALAGTLSTTFENIDLPLPDLKTTELNLTNGAKTALSYTGIARLGALYFDGTPQPNGTYGSSSVSPPPGYVDDEHFDLAGLGTVALGTVTPVITWSDPAPIVYGTALSSMQLNATRPPGSGTLTYTPPAGEVLALGSHTLHVDFTPSDPDLYSAVSKEVAIEVGKATPVITWANPEPIVAGTPLSDTQLNATCPVSGTLTYNPPADTVLAAGTHTLHVDFVPDDPDSYNSTFKEVSLEVRPSPAYVEWINERGLTLGDAAVDADPDQDGLSNGLEFVLGSEPNPANEGATTLAGVLPVVSQDSGVLIFTFERADLSLGAASVTFQWSTDLTFPTANDVVVPDSGTTTINDVKVAITDGSPKDTIVITVPAAKAAGGKLFGRIHASVP